MNARIKVLQLTVGLGWGGAEKLMADIAMRLPSERYDCHVVSLKGDGPVGDVPPPRWRPSRSSGRRRPPWRDIHTVAGHMFPVKVPDIVHSHLLKANLARGSSSRTAPTSCGTSTTHQNRRGHFVAIPGGPLDPTVPAASSPFRKPLAETFPAAFLQSANACE
jgi:hypothetical protein